MKVKSEDRNEKTPTEIQRLRMEHAELGEELQKAREIHVELTEKLQTLRNHFAGVITERDVLRMHVQKLNKMVNALVDITTPDMAHGAADLNALSVGAMIRSSGSRRRPYAATKEDDGRWATAFGVFDVSGLEDGPWIIFWGNR